MKKEIIFTACTAIVFSLTGCADLDTHNNHNDQRLNRMQDPVEDVTYHGPSKELQKHSKQSAANGEFGHTHYSRKPGRQNALSANHIPKTDIQAMSDMIARLEVALPDIYDVGTLVTDKYVLIAYKTTNDNREEAAQQVKKTALSIVPNFYEVYISDEPFAQTDIANYKDLTVGTPRVQSWLDNLVKQMKKSPQGTSSPQTHDMNK